VNLVSIGLRKGSRSQLRKKESGGGYTRKRKGSDHTVNCKGGRDEIERIGIVSLRIGREVSLLKKLETWKKKGRGGGSKKGDEQRVGTKKGSPKDRGQKRCNIDNKFSHRHCRRRSSVLLTFLEGGYPLPIRLAAEGKKFSHRGRGEE